MKKVSNTGLWVADYRPVNVADTILPERIKAPFRQMADSREIGNLLLEGPPGCGKTTLAKALCEEIGADYIVINGSDESGIDVLRTKIRTFASVGSLSSDARHKVVIVDEADYLNCLSENETVLLSSGELIKLSDMNDGEIYSVNSMSADGTIEQDSAEVVNRTVSEMYEIKFENGKTLRCTGDHPIMCKDSSGKIVERTIVDGFDDVEVIFK